MFDLLDAQKMNCGAFLVRLVLTLCVVASTFRAVHAIAVIETQIYSDVNDCNGRASEKNVVPLDTCLVVSQNSWIKYTFDGTSIYATQHATNSCDMSASAPVPIPYNECYPNTAFGFNASQYNTIRSTFTQESQDTIAQLRWAAASGCAAEDVTTAVAVLFDTGCVDSISSSRLFSCVDAIPTIKTCDTVPDCSCELTAVNTQTVSVACTVESTTSYRYACMRGDTIFNPSDFAPREAPTPTVEDTVSPVSSPVVKTSPVVETSPASGSAPARPVESPFFHSMPSASPIVSSSESPSRAPTTPPMSLQSPVTSESRPAPQRAPSPVNTNGNVNNPSVGDSQVSRGSRLASKATQALGGLMLIIASVCMA